MEGNALEYWKNRVKGEKSSTLISWLEDWDKHLAEKDKLAYQVIENELLSRGVMKNNRKTVKEMEEKQKSEFYRFAYTN